LIVSVLAALLVVASVPALSAGALASLLQAESADSKTIRMALAFNLDLNMEYLLT
jgi:hypothetical protein